MQSAVVPCYLVRLRPTTLPQHPVLGTPSAIFRPQYERRNFTPNKQQANVILYMLLILAVIDSISQV